SIRREVPGPLHIGAVGTVSPDSRLVDEPDLLARRRMIGGNGEGGRAATSPVAADRDLFLRFTLFAVAERHDLPDGVGSRTGIDMHRIRQSRGFSVAEVPRKACYGDHGIAVLERSSAGKLDTHPRNRVLGRKCVLGRTVASG